MVVFFILLNSFQCKRQLEWISYQKSWCNMSKSPYFVRISFSVVLHVIQCFSCLFGGLLIVVQDVAYTYLVQRVSNCFRQNFYYIGFFNQNWRLVLVSGRLSCRRPDSKCSRKKLRRPIFLTCLVCLLHCGCFQRWNSFDEGPICLYMRHCVCGSAAFLPALHRSVFCN